MIFIVGLGDGSTANLTLVKTFMICHEQTLSAAVR